MVRTIELEPLQIEVGGVEIRSQRGLGEIALRRFQEETIDFFSSPYPYLFLLAPTGSGKTFTLLSPLLSNILYGTEYDGALGIYPTKPLTIDQFESLKSTLEKFGGKRGDRGSVPVYEASFEVRRGCLEKGWSGKIGLVVLTKDEINKMRQGEATGRSVLERIREELLREDVDYLIALAVPEYPYLMLSHTYRSHYDVGKILSLVADGEYVYRVSSGVLSQIDNEDSLRRYVDGVYKNLRALVESRVAERELAELSSALLPPVLFFDEFHTWNFYELPTTLSLVLLHRLASLLSARREGYKVVFSSATPNQAIVDVLGKVSEGEPVKVVSAKVVDGSTNAASKIRGRTTIELYPIETKASGYPAWMELDNSLPKVVEEKCSEIIGSKRAIVFGRRVCAVEEAAEAFRNKTKVVPVVITGVHPPPGFGRRDELVAKKASGELYVFGNYAIELGVDLQGIVYSIISAASLGELVQRMGRSGRGGIDSKVIILMPAAYVDEVLHRLSGRSRASYYEFIGAMGWVMPGEVAVRKLGNEVILSSRIGKLRLYLPLATYVLMLIFRHRDKPRDLKEALSKFISILRAMNIDKGFFSWLRERVPKSVAALVDLASFRLSPSVPYARTEGQVDGEAALATLLLNYDVSIDTSSGFRLVIGRPTKRSARDVLSLELEHPDRDLLKCINGTVLQGKVALELIGGMVSKGSRNRLLMRAIEGADVPLYVICRDEGGEGEAIASVIEVLHAHGQAILLEHSGEPYAYLLLL